MRQSRDTEAAPPLGSPTKKLRCAQPAERQGPVPRAKQGEAGTTTSKGLGVRQSRDAEAAPPLGSPTKKLRCAQPAKRQGPVPSDDLPEKSNKPQPPPSIAPRPRGRPRKAAALGAQGSPDPKRASSSKGPCTPVQTKLQRPRPPVGALSAKALAARALLPDHAEAHTSARKKAAAGKAAAAGAQQGGRRVPLRECVVDGERFCRGDCAYVISEGCDWEVQRAPSI